MNLTWSQAELRWRSKVNTPVNDANAAEYRLSDDRDYAREIAVSIRGFPPVFGSGSQFTALPLPALGLDVLGGFGGYNSRGLRAGCRRDFRRF